MLTRFVETKIESLNKEQLIDFKSLLAEQDPQLSQWLLEQQQPQDKGLSAIVRLIQKANNL